MSLATMLRPSRKDTSDRPTPEIDRLSARAHDAIDRFAAAVSRGGRGDSEAERWLAMGDEWARTTVSYVRQHPFVAVGVAAAAGYLLSRIAR